MPASSGLLTHEKLDGLAMVNWEFAGDGNRAGSHGLVVEAPSLTLPARSSSLALRARKK
jgi:hypothetical protein